MAGKNVHFIGLCGKGMSAVAHLLQIQGWRVTGSDEAVYPPVSTYLNDHGLTCAEGFRPANIPEDVDLIVIGKNARLTPETNPEVAVAFTRGVPVKSYPEILHDLTKTTENIVVAGSYGKSTCTALLAWCLREAGKDPSYFIGEVVRGLEEHAQLGSGPIFVLEGDEYPSANWDPTAKFLHYHPTDLLLTATAHDHVNIFPTQADFEVPFAQLIDLLPAEGMLVVCADEVHAKQLAGTSGRPVIFYGLTSPDVTWSATDIHFGERTEFILTRDHQPVVSLTTSLLGRHNVENIVGVAALLLEKRLLSAEELARGIKSFLGVKRRMELLTQNTSVPVYEGFGSSYDKARAAIEAIRLHFPGRRLVVAFEPHTFSWRSRAMLPWYDDVFAGSDLVVVYEPASQGAATHDQVDQKEIVTRIRATGLTVHGVSTPHEMLEVLQQTLEPHDVVLILTSGGFDGLVDAIPALVEKTFAR